MPGYGKQSAAAGRGFWRASRNMEQLYNYYQNGSLLASNFNQLWCFALNLVHSGEPVKYFAMLHDDIGPQDYWLDALIAELEDKQLDVLSVAVPIKDNRGMTSMALHSEGENWMPLSRLSMHDIHQLPETFTSEDVGAPLLLNTGCWVCKWDQSWCKKVHFEINDRIVFNQAANRFQAQTEPEDWFFSRLCHELGLKVGGTRKISLQHTGEMDFTNTRPWGTNPFDVESTDKSPVPFAHPYDIDGWLLPQEGKALAELARGKRVLEIGSYCGLSTVCMARTAEHVTAVDYFDGRCTAVPSDCLPKFYKSLERHGVRHKVTTCHPDIALPPGPYDLAFIDGAHDLESVRADIEKALGVLSDGGLIAFHDYHSGIDMGVDVAVDELLGAGGELISITKTVAVVKPPAAIPLEV
jgi:hypothetical protein